MQRSYQNNSRRFSRGNRGSRFSKSNRSSRPQSKPIAFTKYIKQAEPVTFEEYTPSFSFQDLDIHPSLKKQLSATNFNSPTPIQDKTIQKILDGESLVGLANTGTGKTAAFLIPLIDETLNGIDEKKFIQHLIIAPTRELAIQIEQELMRFTTRDMKIFSTVCVGGSNIERQIQRLKYRNHFIIGTPGRLVDLINRGVLNFKQTKTLVLDEVDRMLDMGFRDDIDFLIQQMSSRQQNLFFSATLDKEIEPFIQKYQPGFQTISVKQADSSNNVHQDVVKIKSREEKISTLSEILNSEECRKALVFLKTKIGTESVAKNLRRLGHYVELIHGDKSLGHRKKALERFKNNEVDILIATDVAARGLDIKDISHVINYDEPENFDTYIHRIGRTGRGGKVGWALTFIEHTSS